MIKYLLKLVSITLIILYYYLSVRGQTIESNFSPKLSVGFNFIKPVGRSSENNSWGYGLKAKLEQSVKSNISLFISASYSEILGKSYIFQDDTGDRRVRGPSILPLVLLAGTGYKISKLAFVNASIGYGLNWQNYRVDKGTSLAYSLNTEIIMPKTNNKFSTELSWTSLPTLSIGYLALVVNYKL
jgi:hypothetical protein